MMEKSKEISPNPANSMRMDWGRSEEEIPSPAEKKIRNP